MKIAIQNVSTVLSDDLIQSALPGFQLQISRDFAPHYSDAQLCFFKRGEGIPLDHALLVISDDADQAGELGVHDIQANGMPLGKVFAGTTIRFRGLWSVTMSHELLEMIADPYINLTTMTPDGSFAAFEVCDAVEDDTLGYDAHHDAVSVFVSDFVTPAWFNPMSSDGVLALGPYSFRNNVARPFALARGGYIGVYTPGSGWAQETSMTADWNEWKVAERERAASLHNPHHDIPRPGSRRERRVRGHDNWNRATYVP